MKQNKLSHFVVLCQTLLLITDVAPTLQIEGGPDTDIDT